jgi:hypothetical protein
MVAGLLFLAEQFTQLFVAQLFLAFNLKKVRTVKNENSTAFNRLDVSYGP